MTSQITSNSNSTEATIAPWPVAVNGPVSSLDHQKDATVGAAPVLQAKISTSAGPGSIVASYQNTRIKFNTHPEGRRHGAEFGNKDFVLGVTRDFDDRINIVNRELDGLCSEHPVGTKQARLR